MMIKAFVLLFVVAFAIASPVPAEEKSTATAKTPEPTRPVVPAPWNAGYYGANWNPYAYSGYGAGYHGAYRSGYYPGYTGYNPYAAGYTGYPGYTGYSGYTGYPGYAGYPYGPHY